MSCKASNNQPSIGTWKATLEFPSHYYDDDDDDDDDAHNAAAAARFQEANSGEWPEDPCGLGGELLASGELF